MSGTDLERPQERRLRLRTLPHEECERRVVVVGVCDIRIQTHHPTVVPFGLFKVAGPGIETDEVQVRFDEIGVARQGLFVSLDRFGQLALDLQAIRSQFARARVGLEGVDLAHQRIVNWRLASRGAFRFGHMATRRRLIAEVTVGKPERVVRRSVLGGQLDRPGELFHRGGGLTELGQGPSQTVRRLHEARILTDELGVEARGSAPPCRWRAAHQPASDAPPGTTDRFGWPDARHRALRRVDRARP